MKKLSMLTLALFSMTAWAQKKTVDFTVERIIAAPAEKVWAVVGENYGDVADSHPGLVSSEYVGDLDHGGEGCERVCYLNEDKTKYTQETQTHYNPEEYSFGVDISHVEKLPLDPTYSKATYKVEPVDDGSSKLVITMSLRTKPAFMGRLAKGKFRKNIEDYVLAIEHNVLTGETVSKDNFKEIKKKYKS
ncbi:MAG: SRPBCC family protein [Schleiferiaceae bacterium]|nr:SRPBCC family protein [Schleiferiaceae bacterium]